MTSERIAIALLLAGFAYLVGHVVALVLGTLAGLP